MSRGHLSHGFRSCEVDRQPAMCILFASELGEKANFTLAIAELQEGSLYIFEKRGDRGLGRL